MKHLRQYIRQILMLETRIEDPMVQKALDQVLEAMNQGVPEDINTMLHLLELHLDLASADELSTIENALLGITKSLPVGTVEVVEFLKNNNLSKDSQTLAKLAISFLYSRGRDFVNVRKALKMGIDMGFHKAPIKNPSTPGGMGYSTGGSSIEFSIPADAEEFVAFLDEIGMNRNLPYSQWNTRYVHPSQGMAGEDFNTVMIWNG